MGPSAVFFVNGSWGQKRESRSPGVSVPWRTARSVRNIVSALEPDHQNICSGLQRPAGFCTHAVVGDFLPEREITYTDVGLSCHHKHLSWSDQQFSGRV